MPIFFFWKCIKILWIKFVIQELYADLWKSFWKKTTTFYIQNLLHKTITMNWDFNMYCDCSRDIYISPCNARLKNKTYGGLNSEAPMSWIIPLLDNSSLSHVDSNFTNVVQCIEANSKKVCISKDESFFTYIH